MGNLRIIGKWRLVNPKIWTKGEIRKVNKELHLLIQNTFLLVSFLLMDILSFFCNLDKICRMKNFIGILFIFNLLAACTPNDPPVEPTSKRDLLIGNWISQSQVTRVTVGGSTSQIDSIFLGVGFNFTSSFWVYSDYLGFKDTSRFNCNEDTLYFIKQAMAIDTAIVEEIDASSMLLATDTKTGDINGKIYKQQTLLRFIKN